MPGHNGAAEIRIVESPVERAIKDGISEYAVKKELLKEKRKKLETALLQDHKYSNAKTVLSETGKIRKEEKERILKENADLRDLDSEIRNLAKDMQEQQLSIFDYLLDYNTKTGKKIIVDNAGEKHYITIEAKTDL